MKNKILEAVLEGIKLSFMIDDQNEDENYVKSKISNVKEYVPYDIRMVDLGLSVLWAEYNLGAYPSGSPESWYGNYYAWGETDPKDSYIELNYKFYKDECSFIKYNRLDKKLELDSEDDAVSVKYPMMHMPTVTLCRELIANTTLEYVKNYNGVQGLNGVVFTGENCNKIFVPISGYKNESLRIGGSGHIYTSDLYNGYDLSSAFFLFVDIDSATTMSHLRFYGFPTRAVQDKEFKSVINETHCFMLDDQTEDEEFVKSKVSNGIDFKKLQEKFDNMCISEDFNSAMEFFSKWECLEPYKIKTLKTLIKLNDYDDTKGYKFNPNAFDLSKYLTVIDSEGKELKIHEVDNTSNMAFLKFDDQDHEPIYISMRQDHHESPDKLKFQTKNYPIINDLTLSSILNDYDGIENTRKFILAVRKANTPMKMSYLNKGYVPGGYKIPAVSYCNKCRVKIGQDLYLGYLPACSQMLQLMNIIDIVNNIFLNKFAVFPLNIDMGDWWTSTELDASHATCYYNGAQYTHAKKSDTCKVVPFFYKKTK